MFRWILFVGLHSWAVVDKSYMDGLKRLESSQRRADVLLRSLGIQGHERQGPDRSKTKGESGSGDQSAPRLAPLRIPSGKLLFAKTIHEIWVSSEEAPAIVQLDIGQGVLSGLRLSGIARRSGAKGRISIDLRSLHFRSGRTLTIRGQALDAKGALGLAARSSEADGLVVAAAVATSFATQAADSVSGPFQGAAKTAIDRARHRTEESESVLVVPFGAAVTVFIQEEVRW